MAKRVIQKQRLLDYLRANEEGITTRDIIILLDILSPQKIISNLEEDGYKISKEYDEKNGKKQNYKRYKLIREE